MPRVTDVRFAGAESGEAGVGDSDVRCPECLHPLLELVFGAGSSDGRGLRAVEGELLSPRGARRTREAVQHELDGAAVRTTSVPLEQLADPCLVLAARAAGLSITTTSLLVAHGLGSMDPTRICRHGLLVNGHLCTTLAYATGLEPGEASTLAGDAARRVSLVNVTDLFFEPRPEADRCPLPIDAYRFEMQPTEEALSWDALDALQDWIPARCTTPQARGPWGHMVLVSHVWRDGRTPGTREDLQRIKDRVDRYIKEVLAKPPQARVKAKERKDFGIWIDYMLVPNDSAHAACPDCLRRKAELVEKINGVLTIATVLAMNPERKTRGWILQEMSGNTHEDEEGKKLRLLHRARVRLMAGMAEFTRASDGRDLRCHELVRLGQTPRTWPAVNVALLDALLEERRDDEAYTDAAPTLMRFARHFDEPCHRLKALMVRDSQELAKSGFIDLAGLSEAIDAQGQAMRELATHAPTTELAALSLPSLEERIVATARLQLQLFVATAMGLRAEWLHRAGLASWVRSTALSDALAGVKFMVRWRNRQAVLSEVTSNVTVRDTELPPAPRFRYAQAVSRDGVDADAARTAYGALLEEIEQEVRERAYFRWLARGSGYGRDQEDWFAAEDAARRRRDVVDASDPTPGKTATRYGGSFRKGAGDL